MDVLGRLDVSLVLDPSIVRSDCPIIINSHCQKLSGDCWKKKLIIIKNN